jgi:hypothetical protein
MWWGSATVNVTFDDPFASLRFKLTYGHDTKAFKSCLTRRCAIFGYLSSHIRPQQEAYSLNAGFNPHASLRVALSHRYQRRPNQAVQSLLVVAAKQPGVMREVFG